MCRNYLALAKVVELQKTICFLQLNLEKESPETRKILTEIQKLENEGYQFEAAEASFELLVQRLMGREKKFFKTNKVEISAEKIGDDNPTVQAYITVQVKNEETTKTASGNGPVDALYKALRDALVGFYPAIGQIHLTDYKVRVVNSEGGTGAKVRVFIEFQDEHVDAYRAGEVARCELRRYLGIYSCWLS